jgi:hypothetical protein
MSSTKSTNAGTNSNPPSARSSAVDSVKSLSSTAKKSSSNNNKSKRPTSNKAKSKSNSTTNKIVLKTLFPSPNPTNSSHLVAPESFPWASNSPIHTSLPHFNPQKAAKDVAAPLPPKASCFIDPEAELIRLPDSIAAEITTWRRIPELLPEKNIVIYAQNWRESRVLPANSAFSQFLAAQLNLALHFFIHSAGSPSGHFPIDILPVETKQNWAKFNEKGRYLIKLFYHGEWRAVTVDDSVPLNAENHSILPISSNAFEIWPLLVGKALIKLRPALELTESSSLLLFSALTGLLSSVQPTFPAHQYPSDCSPQWVSPITIPPEHPREAEQPVKLSETQLKQREEYERSAAKCGERGWFNELKQGGAQNSAALAGVVFSQNSQILKGQNSRENYLNSLLSGPKQRSFAPAIDSVAKSLANLSISAENSAEITEKLDILSPKTEKKALSEQNHLKTGAKQAELFSPQQVSPDDCQFTAFLVLVWDENNEKSKLLTEKVEKRAKSMENGAEKSKKGKKGTGNSSNQVISALSSLSAGQNGQNLVEAETKTSGKPLKTNKTKQNVLEEAKLREINEQKQREEAEKAKSNTLLALEAEEDQEKQIEQFLRGADLVILSPEQRDQSKVKLINCFTGEVSVCRVYDFVFLFNSVHILREKHRFQHNFISEDILRNRAQPFSTQGNNFLWLPRYELEEVPQNNPNPLDSSNNPSSSGGGSAGAAKPTKSLSAKQRGTAAAAVAGPTEDSNKILSSSSPSGLPLLRPIPRHIYLHIETLSGWAQNQLQNSPFSVEVEEFDWLTGRKKVILAKSGCLPSEIIDLSLPPAELVSQERYNELNGLINRPISGKQDRESTAAATQPKSAPKKSQQREKGETSAFIQHYQGFSSRNPLGALYKIRISAKFGYECQAFSHFPFLFEHETQSSTQKIAELQGILAKSNEISYAAQPAGQNFLVFKLNFEISEIFGAENEGNGAIGSPAAPASPSCADSGLKSPRTGRKLSQKRPSGHNMLQSRPISPIPLASPSELLAAAASGSSAALRGVCAPVISDGLTALNLLPSATLFSAALLVLDEAIRPYITVEIINNDDYSSYKWATLELPTSQFLPNQRGYTLLAHSSSPFPLAAGRLFLQTSASYPLLSYNFESTTTLTQFSEEFKGNSGFFVLRAVLGSLSGTISSTAVAINCNSAAQTKGIGLILRVFDLDEYQESAEAQPLFTRTGFDSLFVPNLIISKEIRYFLELKFDPLTTLDHSGAVSLSSGRWSVRCLSSGAVTLALDRSEEEEFSALKASWERGEAGRAKKARALREEFLQSSDHNAVKPEDAGALEEKEQGGEESKALISVRASEKSRLLSESYRAAQRELRKKAELVGLKHKISLEKHRNYSQFINSQLIEQENIISTNEREYLHSSLQAQLTDRANYRGKMLQQQTHINELEKLLALNANNFIEEKEKKKRDKEQQDGKTQSQLYIELVHSLLPNIELLPQWKGEKLLNQAHEKLQTVAIEAIHTLLANIQAILQQSNAENDPNNKAKLKRGGSASNKDKSASGGTNYNSNGAVSTADSSASASGASTKRSFLSKSSEQAINQLSSQLQAASTQAKQLVRQSSDTAGAIETANIYLFNHYVEQLEKVLEVLPTPNSSLGTIISQSHKPTSASANKSSKDTKPKATASAKSADISPDYATMEQLVSWLQDLAQYNNPAVNAHANSARVSNLIEKANDALTEYKAMEAQKQSAAQAALLSAPPAAKSKRDSMKARSSVSSAASSLPQSR